MSTDFAAVRLCKNLGWRLQNVLRCGCKVDQTGSCRIPTATGQLFNCGPKASVASFATPSALRPLLPPARQPRGIPAWHHGSSRGPREQGRSAWLPRPPWGMPDADGPASWPADRGISLRDGLSAAVPHAGGVATAGAFALGQPQVGTERALPQQPEANEESGGHAAVEDSDTLVQRTPEMLNRFIHD